MNIEELRRWAVAKAIQSGNPDIVGTAKLIVEFVHPAAPVEVTSSVDVVRRGGWMTPERTECIEAEYEVVQPFRVLLAKLNAMPGAPVKDWNVKDYASTHGLRRPLGSSGSLNLAKAREAKAVRRLGIGLGAI